MNYSITESVPCLKFRSVTSESVCEKDNLRVAQAWAGCHTGRRMLQEHTQDHKYCEGIVAEKKN